MTTEYMIGDMTRGEWLNLLGIASADDPKLVALAATSWGGNALKVLQVNTTENGWQFAAVASYTDEQAQDAVGAMVDSSLVYADATPLLSRAALAGDVTAAQGSNSLTIAAHAVTFAKFIAATAAGIVGATAAGDFAQLTALQGRTVLRNACMVKPSANQTGANYTTLATVAWDAEAYDDGGWHDNVTNNTRLTVPSGVDRVRVGAGLALTNVTGGVEYTMLIIKNGSGSYDGRVQNSGIVTTTLGPRLALQSGPIPVAAGDYFELQLRVTTDTSIDITVPGSYFWIEAC